MNLDALSVQHYKEEQEKKVQRSIVTARLAKIETSKWLKTAVSLGQRRMHGCSKPR